MVTEIIERHHNSCVDNYYFIYIRKINKLKDHNKILNKHERDLSMSKWRNIYYDMIKFNVTRWGPFPYISLQMCLDREWHLISGPIFIYIHFF